MTTIPTKNSIMFTTDAIEDIPRVSNDDVEQFQSYYQSTEFLKSLNDFLAQEMTLDCKAKQQAALNEIFINYVKKLYCMNTCNLYPQQNNFSSCPRCLLNQNQIQIYFSTDRNPLIIIPPPGLPNNYAPMDFSCSTALSLKRKIQEQRPPLNSPFHDLSPSGEEAYLKILSLPIGDFIMRLFPANQFEDSTRRYVLESLLYNRYPMLNPIAFHNTFSFLDDMATEADDQNIEDWFRNFFSPTCENPIGSQIPEKSLISEKQVWNELINNINDVDKIVEKYFLYLVTHGQISESELPVKIRETKTALICHNLSEFIEGISTVLPSDFLQWVHANINNWMQCFNFYQPKLLSANIIENIFFHLSTHRTSFPIQIMPPSEKELAAIFNKYKTYCYDPQSPSSIFYDDTVNFIHLYLSNLLAKKSIKTILAETACDPSAASIKINTTRNHFFRKYFLQEPQASCITRLLQSNYIPKYNAAAKQANTFNHLRSLLYTISAGQIPIILSLAELFVDIFLPKELLSKRRIPLTIVHCNNTKYVLDFLNDVLQFQIEPAPMQVSTSRVTLLSPTVIANNDNLNTLIVNKHYGNIVNIDKIQNANDYAKIKNLILGAPIKKTDEILGEISYSATNQFIYLTQEASAIETLVSIFNSKSRQIKVMYLNGNLENAVYTPLNWHEKFFLLTGFLEYSLSKDNKFTSDKKISIPGNDAAIDRFLNDFCNISINKDSLAKIDISTITGTENTKHCKEIQQSLGITLLEFISRDELFLAFQKWYKSSFLLNTQTTKDTFTSHLKEKYTELYYAKKFCTPKYDLTEKKEYRGFYGISLKVQELNDYCNQATQASTNTRDNELKFTKYLTYLLETYKPHI